MTGTRYIALVTNSPVSAFGDYLAGTWTHDPERHIDGVLGHDDYKVILSYYPLDHPWPFLGDQIPDVVFYLNHDRFFDGDEPRPGCQLSWCASSSNDPTSQRAPSKTLTRCASCTETRTTS